MHGGRRLVHELTSIQRCGLNPREADGVRVEKFSRIQFWNKLWTWAIPWTSYLHVNVQRHCVVRERKQKNLYCESSQSYWLCSKIHARALVVSWAWIRKRNGTELTLHPVFRGSSAFGWDLKSKRKGKLSTHFNGSDETVEVILRRLLLSVKQFSIYGAVADMCGDLACEVSRHSKGTGETRIAWDSGNHGNATWNVHNRSNFSDWCRSTSEQTFQSTFN